MFQKARDTFRKGYITERLWLHIPQLSLNAHLHSSSLSYRPKHVLKRHLFDFD
jgi:hypothetical protein